MNIVTAQPKSSANQRAAGTRQLQVSRRRRRTTHDLDLRTPSGTVLPY
jgi:hypothetical protein